MDVKRALATIAALTLAAGLSGCATKTGSPAPAQAGSNRPAAVATTVEPETPPTTEATVDASAPLAFGDTMTYTDGLSITVSKGAKFTPSDTSMGTGKFFVKYTVVIVNGTDAVFDPSMFHATAQSSNVEGDQVFDSARGMDGGPSTKLLKGREAKFVIGFGVEDPKDIVLEVTPSFEHNSALFN
jgi:hypothetical protein